MINLEQVKLLETKVAKAIDYIERLAKENTVCREKETEMQVKLDAYQQRIEELEVLIMRFKEDQGRIEDSILAALDRLNQFEEAIEKSLSGKPAAAKEPPRPLPQEIQAPADAGDSGDAKICFEIPESITADIIDPLELDEMAVMDSDPPDVAEDPLPAPLASDGELDIF